MNSKFETYLLDQEAVESVEVTHEASVDLKEVELPEGFLTSL